MGTSCATPDNEDIAKATEELSVISTLRELVMTQNACALDGVQIRYDTFLPCMWRAVPAVPPPPALPVQFFL